MSPSFLFPPPPPPPPPPFFFFLLFFSFFFLLLLFFFFFLFWGWGGGGEKLGAAGVFRGEERLGLSSGCWGMRAGQLRSHAGGGGRRDGLTWRTISLLYWRHGQSPCCIDVTGRVPAVLTSRAESLLYWRHGQSPCCIDVTGRVPAVLTWRTVSLLYWRDGQYPCCTDLTAYVTHSIPAVLTSRTVSLSYWHDWQYPCCINVTGSIPVDVTDSVPVVLTSRAVFLLYWGHGQYPCCTDVTDRVRRTAAAWVDDDRPSELLIMARVDDFDWLMIAYIALFSALLSRLTALACGSTWVTSFWSAFFWISTEVVYLQRWHGWCHMKLQPSRRKCCVHHTTMHRIISCKSTYVRCMRVYL